MIYTAGNVFLGSYMRTIRRTQAAHLHNQALADELEKANRQLQEYSTQVEQLAAARERNRLARELHDSVTQTAFSMNLTTQSATLLLERDPSRVEEQLERLYGLTRSAMGEIQLLIKELKPQQAGQESLLAGLRRLLADSRFSARADGGLSVSIEAEGEKPLQAFEEQSLLRIAQEALNNILKHAHTLQAHIRLHLEEPFWLEIEDHGQGFDPTASPAQRQGGPGKHERARGRDRLDATHRIVPRNCTGRDIRVEKSPTTGR